MKNNLIGIAVLFAASSMMTSSLLVFASLGAHSGSFDTQDKREEYRNLLVKSAYSGKAIPLTNKPEKEKKKYNKDMQASFDEAIRVNDCENKKAENKEIKKVAPQEKFKCMPPAKEKKHTEAKNAQKRQGKKSQGGSRGADNKTESNKPGSPYSVGSVSRNKQAIYAEYLAARRDDRGKAFAQDFCKDNPSNCKGGEIEVASSVDIDLYQDKRNARYDKEIKETAQAVKEANRQFLERHLAQKEQLRKESVISAEKAENERLKTIETATNKFPKKFHDSSSGQGRTAQS